MSRYIQSLPLHRDAVPNPTFTKLNFGWNAEPNAPDPRVTVHGDVVRLVFTLNPFAYEAKTDEAARLTFRDCSRWRLGSTNDEGWRRGQCRYSGVAPAWGEFYALQGADDRLPEPSDWHALGPASSDESHFLFYLRDDTFECFAREWSFERYGAPA